MDNIPHGTDNGYNNFECRCDLCKNARVAKNMERINADSFVHGRRGGRTSGCKCEKCRSSNNEYRRKYRKLHRVSKNKKPEKKCGDVAKYRQGCRCKLCTKANSDYCIAYRRSRKSMPIKTHGRYGYELGCRCDACKSASSEYKKSISGNARIANLLRQRLWKAVKSGKRAGSAVRDLGCSIPEFKVYLESMFCDGMNWSNYGNKIGQWNIDHIIPLCTLDLTDRDQFLIGFHYTNTRPMWHIDNIRRPKDGSDVL